MYMHYTVHLYTSIAGTKVHVLNIAVENIPTYLLVLYIVPEGPELSQLEDIKGRGPHRKVKW